MRGGQRRRVMVAGGMSSPNGVVVVGGVGVPLTVGHGLEARGGGSGACGMLAKEEESGKTKARAVSAMPFIGAVGGRGRRGGSGAESAWKREMSGERGCPSAAIGDWHRPVADGCRQAVCTTAARHRVGEARCL
jgi:hypothetical protein